MKWRGEQFSEPHGSGARPTMGVLLDVMGKQGDLWPLVVEDTGVPQLPDAPGCQDDDRSESTVQCSRGMLHGPGEPLTEVNVMAWKRGSGDTTPGEDLVPDLAGEAATSEKVLHGLGLLIAEEAQGSMGEASARQAVGGPATPLKGKPQEDFDAKGRP
jgi:hypothetical protein